MLLELAIGDAYGAGFEYVDRDMVARLNTAAEYVRHPTHALAPGRYTDDTQMSLAVAELLVSGDEWTPLSIASKFVDAFHRDPRQGYASSFYQFLRSVRTGAEFLRRISPDSDKSGAAMRAGPIGVLPSIDEVKRCSTIQAKLTHDTPNGINAAIASALLAHYFLYDLGPIPACGEFLDTHAAGITRWSDDYHGKVKSKGWMSVQAAVTAVKRNSSLTGLLRDCIAFTGDVDTVATIALGAAACCKNYEHDLPSALNFGLEHGRFGRDYVVALDEQLLASRGAA